MYNCLGIFAINMLFSQIIYGLYVMFMKEALHAKIEIICYIMMMLFFRTQNINYKRGKI